MIRCVWMMEVCMARRRIGQEQLIIPNGCAESGSPLERMSGLIDWTQIDRQFDEISSSPRGEAGWPPLSLFKGLLLATWHDLSDVKLGEALADRASFRRFCGFSTNEPTPERTAFVRFRAELMKRGLDRSLFEAITAQLKTKGVVVRTGTLVDATLIPSASVRHDDDARWAGRRRKPGHGYKAHIATDQDAALIETVEVTTANVHDAALLDVVLPPEPGDVYGDSAFAGRSSEQLIIACGGVPLTVQTGTWGGQSALERLEAHNAKVRRVRCRIEKVFGTSRRSYGLRRMRWIGLAKAGLQTRLTAMAYNIRRSFGIVCAAAT
jgi:IS5 family transposase